jgi:hypothetical protein
MQQRVASYTKKKPLTIKELKSYPLAARTLELPEPTSQGKIRVAADRDGPFAMHYKTFGRGQKHIIVRLAPSYVGY